MPVPPFSPPTRDPSTRPLTIVLRVAPSLAGLGRVTGTAEVVDTGDVVPISDVGDLIALLAQLAATPRSST